MLTKPIEVARLREVFEQYVGASASPGWHSRSSEAYPSRAMQDLNALLSDLRHAVTHCVDYLRDTVN